jgi:hypothetical protein
MGVIRDSPYTGRLREGDKELIRDYVRPQTVYFYLQVEEHFNGNYSQKILEANKPNDFDAHLALQAYYTHFILCQNKKAKKQRNLLQEKNRDNIFYPTYFMLLSSMFKTMKSWRSQKQNYLIKEEGLKERLEEERTVKKASEYIDRHSSHIQILRFPKRLGGEQEEQTKTFWIPPAFKYLIQEEKDRLWLSFNKENAETLWISVWKSWHEICKKFYAREQVNQMSFRILL